MRAGEHCWGGGALPVPVAQGRLGSGGSLQLLVSACRLWKDLQTFCCSEGKCNFHDNSNLNCTLKVRELESPSPAPIPMSSSTVLGVGCVPWSLQALC